jgi:glycosyltransferase involved in cell wall biosynthesis
VPRDPKPERFRRKFGVDGRFAIYIGRIDANKGCAELFEFFRHYAKASPEGLMLVLVGNAILPIPHHPRIRHLGFLPDEDKFDALAAADLLIMPSYFESLSMVALEAWALGKPVLANGRCDVLKGQCQRSNAGLFYEGYGEFAETLQTLEHTPSLVSALGENGRTYFSRHYAWPVIERKYLDMLSRLGRESAGDDAGRLAAWPLPAWRERRRRTLPPASQVVDEIPQGPSRSADA